MSEVTTKLDKLEYIIRPTADTNAILSRLRKHIVEFEGHWLWQRPHNGDGRFFLRKRELMPTHQTRSGDGRLVSARRLIYMMYNGEIPAGRYISCSCDVWPPCVNPAHLTLE